MKKHEHARGDRAMPDNRTALTAGIWYIICTFITKGISFISTPVFTRLMTKTVLGTYTNLSSWLTIFSTVTSCDFHTSIIRSKYDFDGDVDSYAFSILTLTFGMVALFAAVCALFRDFIFGSVLHVDESYGAILILYLMFFPAYNIFATLQRVRYRYKIFTVLSLIYAVSSVGAVLILLKLIPDALCARIVGQYAPMVVIGLCLSVQLAVNGKKVRAAHCVYALRLCMPLLPHLISIYGMSAIGKTMVRQLMGVEATAVFGVAYSGMHVFSLLVQSANQGWAPWMLDMLHAGRRDKVRAAGDIYMLAMAALVALLILIAPELVFILGGNDYASAVETMPTLLASCFVQLIYMVYLQTEFYEKKAAAIGANTTIAAISAIVFCALLIPRWGLIGAGWGVLLGYVVLLIAHYLSARHLGYGDILGKRMGGACLALCALLIVSANWLYQNTALRFGLILALSAACCAALWRYRAQIRDYIRGRAKGKR